MKETRHKHHFSAFSTITGSTPSPYGARHAAADDVRSRRGEVTLQARRGTQTQPGSVFIPFHYREAAANILTTDKLDPDGKIPEFKFCAVTIENADR